MLFLTRPLKMVGVGLWGKRDEIQAVVLGMSNNIIDSPANYWIKIDHNDFVAYDIINQCVCIYNPLITKLDCEEMF